MHQRRGHDVARARQARLRTTDRPTPLLVAEPALEQRELLAAVVGLAVLVASRWAVLHHRCIFRLPVAHAGDGLGDMQGGARAVADAEEQDLSIQFVYPPRRTVDAMR